MIFSDTFKKLSDLYSKIESSEKNSTQLLNEINLQLGVLLEREASINRIISEKSKAFPWLAEAIGEFYHFKYTEIAKYLETKKHPAEKSAEQVRLLAGENKVLRKQLYTAQKFVHYYESIFPWIKEYVGENLDDVLEDIKETVQRSTIYEDASCDPVMHYMQAVEYGGRSSGERNQLALERYLKSRKKPHQIGRDYERFVGYLLEKQGYDVEYTGIEYGLEDLGRDLICYKGNTIKIVQCKCWSSNFEIHEKHINQLFGTTMKFYLDHSLDIAPPFPIGTSHASSQTKILKSSLVTSTKLSSTAREFAKALNIETIEDLKLQPYPIIKCNVSSAGDKIYHLPFDQQYDRTKIINPGECYTDSAIKAESMGFKRALRWHGGPT